MAQPPDGYSLQRGAYFSDDGEGPYAWNGTAMVPLGSGGSDYLGEAANEAAMIALSSAVAGSTVWRTDTNTLWVLRTAPYSSAANWENLGAAGGSGSGGGGSGDATITEVSAVNGAGDMQVFKRAGITTTRTFDVDGVTPLYDRTFGATTQLDWQEDLGYLVGDAASNIYMPAAPMSVTWAQAIAIGDAIIAATYTVHNGYPVYVRDIAGGFVMLWNNTLNWWSPYGHRKLLAKALNEASAYDPPADATESGDRFTYTLPGRLMAPNGGKIVTNSMCRHVGAGGIKTHRWYLGATAFVSIGPGAASSLSTRVPGGQIENMGSASSQRYMSNVGMDGGGLSTMQTAAINTAVDQTIAFRHFLAIGTDTSQYDSLEVWLEQ